MMKRYRPILSDALILAAVMLLSCCKSAVAAAPYPQGTEFPLMMYEVNTGSDATKFFKNTYGWNVIQSYGNTTNSLINSYLQMAASNGVWADVTIPSSGSNPNYTEWTQAQVQTWIQGSKTNNNIAWWDFPEESRGGASDVQMFHDYRSWVRLYDTPNPRPIYEVDYGNSVSAGIITNIDILAIESYGTGGYGGNSPHASVRYTVQHSGLGSISAAGATLGSNYLAGQKTLLVDFFCSTPSAGNPTPTPQQCYHDFWSAVASGAQGIEVFAYWHAIHDNPPLTNNLAQYNLAASQISGTELGQVVLFGTNDPLVNFMVTSGQTNTESFSMGGNLYQYPSINVLCKTWLTNAYVIAVNSTSNSVTANITNLPLASGTATVMFESRSVPVSGSGFSDTFQPWGVHIYTMTNSSPPPATGVALQWDAKPTTSGAQDGSGTWGGASTNWINSGNTPWSDYNTAIFGVNTTTNCVVTLASDVMPSNITFNATSGSYTIAGTNKIWTASSGLNITVNGKGTITAPIAGGMGVVCGGSGTLTLSGTNTFTGGTTVNSGKVNVNNNQSAANGGWTISSGSGDANFNAGSIVVVANGSFVSLGGGASTGNTLSVAGMVTNNGTLDIDRRGTLNLNDGASWVQGGDVAISSSSLSSYSGYLNVNSGATFNYIGSNAINISPCANAGGSGVLTLAGGTLFTGQGFANSTATSTGTGTIAFSTNGTLKLTANIANLFTTAGSTNSVTLGTGGGTIDTAGFSTTLDTVISGSGDLTKLGGGTLTLSASNTSTGNTTVSGGTLQLDGSLNSSTLTVANTATLAGTGTANGAVTVQAGGALAPGDDGIGSFAVNNSLTLNGGSFTAMEIAKNSGVLSNDLVSVTGTLTSGGSLVVTNIGTDTLAAGDSFTLFNAGTFGGGFTNVILPALGAGLVWNTNNLPVNGTIAVSNLTCTLTYTAGSNGSISGNSPQTVNYGGSGSAVTAVPDTGYSFVNWSDGSTANPRTDMNVTSNLTVTANFAGSGFTLTYAAGPNGSISGASPQTVAYGGSGSPVTAVANTNYHFVSWSDGSTANPRTDVNVTSNLTVTASFASGLPSPWTTNAIGSLAAAVSANYSGQTFVVTGAGAGLTGKSDSCWFVNLPATNSFTITALVTSQETNGAAPLAGVMIRQDTSGNSLFAFMGLTPNNQAEWISRTSTRGKGSTTTFSGFTAPYWVRIVRDTNTFTGYVSADGASWTQTVSVNLTMSSNVLAGLVVSSGSGSTLNTAMFDNVTVAASSGAPLFPSNVLLSASAQMGSFTVGGGAADFTIAGDSGTLWRLEDSNDLTTWTPLETINLIGGSVDCSQDDDARPARFFRLVPAP